MGKLLLATSYFVVTPMLLLGSFIMLLILHDAQINGRSNLSFLFQPKSLMYAAVPPEQELFAQQVQAGDARIEIVRQFFDKYNSPLEPYAKEVVLAADRYHLDYRLIPAIAMQESTLCKKAPKNSFNCWGFGIYGGRIHMFSDYSEAIDTVTLTLARDYKKQGLGTPEEIMKRYTPSSNGSWARGVSSFMENLNLSP
jgi:hypothetical protein